MQRMDGLRSFGDRLFSCRAAAWAGGVLRGAVVSGGRGVRSRAAHVGSVRFRKPWHVPRVLAVPGALACSGGSVRFWKSLCLMGRGCGRGPILGGSGLVSGRFGPKTKPPSGIVPEGGRLRSARRVTAARRCTRRPSCARRRRVFRCRGARRTSSARWTPWRPATARPAFRAMRPCRRG